ncbi:MAG: hypothetical protein KTR18_10310 [Acidiferrobacterales bacterium]|nr:hypothetical protein [Acidiferrobacterales bacterium]
MNTSENHTVGIVNDIEQKLIAARTRLILDQPFLGALVLRLPLQEANDSWCATIATDARSFFYNSSFIASLSLGETQFVLAHEALHCGLSHFARREHRDRRRWDIACDYAVNQMLIEDGLEPNHGALLENAYQGMTAEEIYPLIPQDTHEESQDRHLYDDSHTPCEHESDRRQECETKQRDLDSKTLAGVPPPLTPSERDRLNTQWQQRLAGAAQQALQSGKMNSNIARLIHRLAYSTVPWRTLLARFMSSANRVDYNLMRPSQRRTGDVFQPSLYAPQTNMVVALDTSGSIIDEELNGFVTEVNAIKGLVNARISLLACDDELDQRGPWIYEPHESMSLPSTLNGSGGTNFTPVFDWIDQQAFVPDLLIYLTDARGRFPNTPPRIETLWLVKGAAEVPWGQRIQLN